MFASVKPKAGYATIPSERTCLSLFPCSPFEPQDFYRKASQRLQEQQQQRTLQQPSLPEVEALSEGTTAHSLAELSDIFAALGVEFQCTISDPALASSLTSSRVCSKQALKGLAALLRPTANKKAKTHTEHEDQDLEYLHPSHMLYNLQSRAVAAFESSWDVPDLQTPLLPKAATQVSQSEQSSLCSVTHMVSAQLSCTQAHLLLNFAAVTAHKESMMI